MYPLSVSCHLGHTTHDTEQSHAVNGADGG
jgi:hypothetical protein